MQAVATEKTLFDVLRDLWRARVYMVVFAVIMLVLAFVFMAFSQNFYRAQMIVAPASTMGQVARDIGEGSIQVQPNELSNNLAFTRFENIYDGVSVANILLKDKEILATLKFDRNFEFSEPRTNWTAEKLSEYLGKRVTIEPVSGTYLRKITYLHPNKELALYMVTQIHSVSDEVIRKSILREVEGRINYLNKSLAATTNPAHRRNLTALLMEQERIKMLVSIDQPYAASIIEPPYVASKPSFPDPYAIYPIFLFVGLLLGFIVYGIRHNE